MPSLTCGKLKLFSFCFDVFSSVRILNGSLEGFLGFFFGISPTSVKLFRDRAARESAYLQNPSIRITVITVSQTVVILSLLETLSQFLRLFHAIQYKTTFNLCHLKLSSYCIEIALL